MWRSKRIDSADWLESMAEEEALPETSENMTEKEAFELAQGAIYDTHKEAVKEWRP
jgi:20S proteasome alpha/beta subunit